jgi:hypothetical protein
MSSKRTRIDLGGAGSASAAAAAADEQPSSKRAWAGSASSGAQALAHAGVNTTRLGGAVDLPSPGQVNPVTGRPLSANYWRIFETRKNLPVYGQRAEFSKMLANTQCMILVGETGSGSVGATSSLCRARRCVRQSTGLPFAQMQVAHPNALLFLPLMFVCLQ